MGTGTDGPKKPEASARAPASAPPRKRTRPSTADLVALTSPTTRPAEPEPTFDELLGFTLPLGPPPKTLAEQRAWAEIRKLQLETERTLLELAALRRRERDVVADPSEAHVYTFYSSVDAESVQQCMAELGQWSRRDPGSPITVIFNSPGGSVLDGLALFDYLRRLRTAGHFVTTMALGRAASMGAVLLQAGDHRVVGENAFLLIHEVSNHTTGKVSEMEDGVDFTRRLQKRLLAILAGRSTLTEPQIARRWTRNEWWLDASEALALGLADAVL
ncbi:MAG TPA: Clp protease ClpP [Acidimicrobiales bacterium]|nr:Clp protease ClpP [Acidimicrobiales bacterium]